MPENATSAGAVKPPRALFTTAVWGEGYLDRFLRYSLPTQLSAGNLGAFDTSSLFLIITAAADIERVTASAPFAALSRMVSTKCVALETIAGSRSNDKYSKLTACQNYALKRSEDFEAIFFGYGDALWADGSYRAAARRLQDGYDVVFSFGHPVVGKRFLTALPQLNGDQPAPAATIPPRMFARAVHEHLHPMALSTKWTNELMPRCPSYVTWDIPGQGMLLRAFHLHPVAVRVRTDVDGFFTPFRSTLDEEFVVQLYRTDPNVYVSTSSDEMCVCSLADETNDLLPYQSFPPKRRGVGNLAQFAETHAGLLHRRLFQHSIRLIIDDVCEDRWHAVEQEAAHLAQEINWRLSIPDSVLALELPAAYVARWRRQRIFSYISPYTEQETDAAVRSSRNASRRLAGKITRILHALRITRGIRIIVFPLLSSRQRQWCYNFVRGIGDRPPLIGRPRHLRRSSTETGWWRWLCSWMRVQA